MELQDRHVVVTGAGRGIGAALARRFHAGGARVSLADLQGAEAVAAELGERAVGFTADVSSEEGNVRLIEQAEAAFGRIDLFFANAGIGGGTDLESTSEEAWQKTFDINVNAHRWAAKHLLPGWLAAGEGYFCSTASAAGLLLQIGSAPYSVTKRAAVAFAEWLAVTYGDQGLRVSCLCPQGVNTDMLRNSEDLGGGASVVRSAGDVLEPEVVADIVADAIAEERFLILPHPQVHEFMKRKADDPDRWLGGMRKLQARVLSQRG
jgi:NAD(P)-dependent dehydrogenase (short-subunit alcohol dehydrogenase family)